MSNMPSRTILSGTWPPGNMLITTLPYRFSRKLMVKLFWHLCGAPLGVHIAWGRCKYCSPLCYSTHCVWSLHASCHLIHLLMSFCSRSFWLIFLWDHFQAQKVSRCLKRSGTLALGLSKCSILCTFYDTTCLCPWRLQDLVLFCESQSLAFIPCTLSSWQWARSIRSGTNAHSAVWLPRWGDLLFELLADLGSNRVIVHDAVELLAGGPDYNIAATSDMASTVSACMSTIERHTTTAGSVWILSISFAATWSLKTEYHMRRH